jgi:hypothetical protein
MRPEVDCPCCIAVLVVTHGRVPRHNRVRRDGRHTSTPCPGSGALVVVVYRDKPPERPRERAPLRLVR